MYVIAATRIAQTRTLAEALQIRWALKRVKLLPVRINVPLGIRITESLGEPGSLATLYNFLMSFRGLR